MPMMTMHPGRLSISQDILHSIWDQNLLMSFNSWWYLMSAGFIIRNFLNCDGVSGQRVEVLDFQPDGIIRHDTRAKYADTLNRTHIVKSLTLCFRYWSSLYLSPLHQVRVTLTSVTPASGRSHCHTHHSKHQVRYQVSRVFKSAMYCWVSVEHDCKLTTRSTLSSECSYSACCFCSTMARLVTMFRKS